MQNSTYVVSQKYVSEAMFQLVYQEVSISKETNSIVYRALRSINPSPYLFFFDYGDFNIWFFTRSSNYCKDRKQKSIPLQGTFKRTGDDEKMPY
jgi:anthranilate/para-aminobenzoate synthase component I